jgi:hypothetical protein
MSRSPRAAVQGRATNSWSTTPWRERRRPCARPSCSWCRCSASSGSPPAQLTGAFSAGQLVSGVAGIAVGRYLDRGGSGKSASWPAFAFAWSSTSRRRPPLHPALDERTGDRLSARLHDRRARLPRHRPRTRLGDRDGPSAAAAHCGGARALTRLTHRRLTRASTQASVGTRVGTRWEQIVSPRGSSCPLVSPPKCAVCRGFRFRTGTASR